MQNPRINTVAFVGMLALQLTVVCACAPAQVATRPFHGALLAAEQITDSRLSTLKLSGVDAITVPIHGSVALRATEDVACEKIRNAGFELYFWVEVARCPELADAHPGWMASLQGHSDWRRLFKDPPTPGDGEVVKTYPWVPILNREPFAGQLSRIESLLQDRPAPAGVFLNDIQGSPSACGCGSHLCRWTSDYGKLRTTTPLGNNAPADFVMAVQTLVPTSEVIPIWTTECEQHDGAHDGLCAGVGCFKGICWKAWTGQLMPVAEQCSTLGALLPYRSFQRDLPIYGPEASWIRRAVKSFEVMPPQHEGQALPASRLLAVLQGWDVSEQQISRQVDVALDAGVNRYLVAYSRIEQSWQPRITKLQVAGAQ